MSTAHQTPKIRHLLGIQDLSTNDIERLLERAGHFADQRHRADGNPAYRKLVCANLFLEPSTRTKMSFEMACKRLGLKVLNFDGPSSSLKKKESLFDTFKTVAAMKPDLMVVRSGEDGFLEKAAKTAEFPLINGGEGTSGHPTQALLDALTIYRRRGSLKGLKIAVCGDIRHSRVAASNFRLLPQLGTEVRAFGPEGMMPKTLPKGIERAKNFKDALQGVDVIMMLRVQLERIKNPPPLGEYFTKYGLTRDKLEHAHPDAIVLHPGPMNRGVEIAPEVADDPARSVILDQVTNGVAVRMAVLEFLIEQMRGQ